MTRGKQLYRPEIVVQVSENHFTFAEKPKFLLKLLNFDVQCNEYIKISFVFQYKIKKSKKCTVFDILKTIIIVDNLSKNIQKYIF
jgi:hypothetical protein